jgi:hypothetical protein
MDHDRLREIQDMLIEINRETFLGHEFSVAYHALAAAYQCSSALEDARSLESIEKLAKDELTEIDKRHPDYEHSSNAAAGRNLESIFELLAKQARARAMMVSGKRDR